MINSFMMIGKGGKRWNAKARTGVCKLVFARFLAPDARWLCFFPSSPIDAHVNFADDFRSDVLVERRVTLPRLVSFRRCGISQE
jgi:hypothetical protein